MDQTTQTASTSTAPILLPVQLWHGQVRAHQNHDWQTVATSPTWTEAYRSAQWAGDRAYAANHRSAPEWRVVEGPVAYMAEADAHALGC